ncbi:MAG: peptide-methionine (R)-S-oxide reductase MsrB [Saprospiraceae bacterium]|nr:peptide-methionine (R)-S-oxide reductase MsrB [Saprospiraceae bacterium]
MRLIHLFLCVFMFLSCQRTVSSQQPTDETAMQEKYYLNGRGDTILLISRPESEWKKILSTQEYYVLRTKGTERAFTGDLLQEKKEGWYTCRACGLPLFHSKHKYESGSGWPSFFDVSDKSSISTTTDYDIGYPRTELTCHRCGGHLGHVFDDGPSPTGMRYCINSVSLDFVEEKK